MRAHSHYNNIPGKFKPDKSLACEKKAVIVREVKSKIMVQYEEGKAITAITHKLGLLQLSSCP